MESVNFSIEIAVTFVAYSALMLFIGFYFSNKIKAQKTTF